MSIEVGAMIRTLREARGLSQAALAQAAGLTRVYITRLEGGQQASIRFRDVRRIAAALRVPPAVLFVDADTSTRTENSASSG